MRIDDLNRTSQAHEAQRNEAVGAKTKNQAASQPSVSGDETHISEMAAALTHGTSKVEALRLQIARGEYHVSSDNIAASVIAEHLLKR